MGIELNESQVVGKNAVKKASDITAGQPVTATWVSLLGMMSCYMDGGLWLILFSVAWVLWIPRALVSWCLVVLTSQEEDHIKERMWQCPAHRTLS